jgi:hypothetical protein
MIPKKIIRFLEERASIGFAATRDGNLVPCGHRVSGWQIDATGDALTAFVAPFARFVDALVDNGRIALTFEELGTHETYQIKGRYLSHRPARPAEINIADRTRERFVKTVRSLYADEQLAAALKASISTPNLAVEIEVHDVFLQTPGPGAGTRIVPAPEGEPSER